MFKEIDNKSPAGAGAGAAGAAGTSAGAGATAGAASPLYKKANMSHRLEPTWIRIVYIHHIYIYIEREMARMPKLIQQKSNEEKNEERGQEWEEKGARGEGLGRLAVVG